MTPATWNIYNAQSEEPLELEKILAVLLHNLIVFSNRNMIIRPM
jgi:hypothetical protein